MPNLPMPEGLTVSDLECVMLDVPAMDIEGAIDDLWVESDLFFGDIPELKYAQGAVAEKSPHLTLLFGIHPSDSYEEDVLVKLEGWDIPDLLINEIKYFPSRIDGQNYICLYAEVIPSASLLIGRNILEELPYTSEFDDYKPHITLAYLRTDTGADTQGWVNRLNAKFAHTMILSDSILLNLGNDD